MSARLEEGTGDMPRGFWNFNINTVLTIIGGSGVALGGVLLFQSMFTTMQLNTAQNTTSVAEVAKDLKEYRADRARRDERTDRVMSKISEDIAYVRGRIDAGKVP